MKTKDNKKKVNLKISNTLIFIGAILTIVGLVGLIKSVIDYNKALANLLEQFNQEVFAISEFPDEKPIFIWVLIFMLGLPILFYGLRPYLIKLGLRQQKETLDYVGDDVTDLGGQAIDIGTPIIGKAVDDLVIPVASKTMDKVVVPTVKNIKKALKDDDSEGANIYCKHCGQSIDSD